MEKLQQKECCWVFNNLFWGQDQKKKKNQKQNQKAQPVAITIRENNAKCNKLLKHELCWN